LVKYLSKDYKLFEERQYEFHGGNCAMDNGLKWCAMTICSCHDIAEILLNLALNINQSICNDILPSYKVLVNIEN
jgi:hypothetical protein